MTPAARRWPAAGGVVGPVAFAAAWAVLGRRQAGYSPISDAISQLAATDAPTRAGMTAGLALLGTGLPLYAVALRRVVPGPGWAAAATTGACSLAVAALPLPASGDRPAHAVAAVLGYASLAAVPLLAATPFARRMGAGWKAPSRLAGAVCGTCLAATTLGPASGLLQRAGLAVGHGWIAASAVALLRRQDGGSA